MRTSGGRGADPFLIAIPVVALAVAGTFSSGGWETMLLTLESAIRHTFTAGVEFVSQLF